MRRPRRKSLRRIFRKPRQWLDDDDDDESIVLAAGGCDEPKK